MTIEKVNWCSMCDEVEVTNHSSLDICNACYSNMYYWKGASIKRLVRRQEALRIYQRRMAAMLGQAGSNEPATLHVVGGSDEKV